MFNKNIIAGLVVVVLVGGGIVFYFVSGNKTTTISIPIARQGELTRELAKQVIADFYSKQAKQPETTLATYSASYHAYFISLMSASQEEQLVVKGLIKILENVAGPSSGHVFAFTDGATPYLTDTTGGNKNVKLSYSKVKDITITGITMHSETLASVNVDVDTDYTYTPFGEVLSTSKSSKESGPLPLVLYDDGWRVSPTGQ